MAKILIDDFIVKRALEFIEYHSKFWLGIDAHPIAQALLDALEHYAELPTNMMPEGWALVPVEPTDEMMQAFKSRYKEDDFWRARITGAVCVMLLSAPKPPVVEKHTDDIAVDRFAAAMKNKLAAARDKGRGGWDDPEQCTVEHLAKLLVDHISKGDPIDVANFAMMLHQREADYGVLAAAVKV